MTSEEIIKKLEEKEVYSLFKFMLKGAGIDRSKASFGKGRALFERLAEMGVIEIGKNHSSDTTGMYFIKDKKNCNTAEEYITMKIKKPTTKANKIKQDIKSLIDTIRNAEEHPVKCDYSIKELVIELIDMADGDIIYDLLDYYDIKSEIK